MLVSAGLVCFNTVVTVIRSGGWAFSTTGAIEGAYQIFKGGKLTSFSEQQLLSCDTGDTGCSGG
jgi:hypothetical protein